MHRIRKGQFGTFVLAICTGADTELFRKAACPPLACCDLRAQLLKNTHVRSANRGRSTATDQAM